MVISSDDIGKGKYQDNLRTVDIDYLQTKALHHDSLIRVLGAHEQIEVGN